MVYYLYTMVVLSTNQLIEKNNQLFTHNNIHRLYMIFDTFERYSGKVVIVQTDPNPKKYKLSQIYCNGNST